MVPAACFRAAAMGFAYVVVTVIRFHGIYFLIFRNRKKTDAERLQRIIGHRPSPFLV